MDGLTIALIVVPLIIGGLMWFGLRQAERNFRSGVKSHRRGAGDDVAGDYVVQSGARDKNAPW